ncbi:MAG: hypothetical protein RL208_131 [Pseudomonadota bacterium]
MLQLMLNEYFLRIEIKNNDPIDINVLSRNFNAYANQYETFLEKQSLEKQFIICDKQDRRLFINNVKQGSIIIDIVANMIPNMPDLFHGVQNFNSIIEFGSYLKEMRNFFSNTGRGECNYSQKDCQEYIDSLSMVNNDSISNVSIGVLHNSGNFHFNVYNINTAEGIESQEIAKKHLNSLSKYEDGEIFYDQVLRLIHGEKKNSIKGIINKFCDKPKNLSYDTSVVEHIINDNNNPFQKAYIVDVKIIKEIEKIVAYKIIKISSPIDDD